VQRIVSQNQPTTSDGRTTSMSKVAALKKQWTQQNTEETDSKTTTNPIRVLSPLKQIWTPPINSEYSQTLMLADLNRYARRQLNRLAHVQNTLQNTDFKYVADIPTLISVPPSTCCAIFLNEVMFASSSRAGDIQIWDIPTHKIFRTIPTQAEEVHKMVALGEDKIVTWLMYDSLVMVFNWKTGEKLNTLRIPMINDMITFGDKYIINRTLNTDYGIKMWDVSIHRGHQFACIRESKFYTSCMAILPQCQLALGFRELGLIKIYDIETLKSTTSVKISKTEQLYGIYTIDRQTIAYLTGDNVIVANYKTGELVNSFDVGTPSITKQISMNILAVYYTDRINLLDIYTGRVIKKLRNPPTRVKLSLDSSLDGRMLISVLEDSIGIYKLYSETDDVAAFFDHLVDHLEWKIFCDVEVVCIESK
jgi:WD40 repeat protein